MLALVKLKVFQEAEIQLNLLPEASKSAPLDCSRWPFALCVVQAQLFLAQGKDTMAVDIVRRLLVRYVKAINRHDSVVSEEEKSTEIRRAIFCALTMVSWHCQLSQHKAALVLLAMLLDDMPLHSSLWWSQICRIFIAVGDIGQARKAHHNCVETARECPLSKQMECQIWYNEAALYLIDGEYDRYKETCERQYKSISSCLWRENNAAIAAMEHGNVKNAVELLEQSFRNDLHKAMFEPIARTLTMLYSTVPPTSQDGSYNGHGATQKLAAFIASCAPEDFDLACCRIDK